MNRIICILIFFLACSLSINAQIDDGWAEVGNSAYSSDLWSATFTSNDIGFAVGNAGAFLKTTNGGLTWTAFNTGYDYFFVKVIFPSSSVGYLIGNKYQNLKGRVLKTTDGGNTWTEILEVTNPNSTYLTEGSFSDINHGCVGGVYCNYVTTNGGTSWTEVSTGANTVRGMYFKSNTEGFFSTGYYIYRTTDGGLSWIQGTYIPEMPRQFFFVDNTNGYVTVANTNILYKTTDGGITWNPTSSTGMVNQSLSGLIFSDVNTGYVCTNDAGTVAATGKIVRTTDGGNTWNLVFEDISYTHRCLAKKPNGELFCMGRGGSILKSANGTNWSLAQRGVLYDRINDLCFINDSTAIAVGGSGIIAKTTNRCASWTMLSSGTTKKLLNITSTSPSILYVTGADSLLLKSTDGGNSWQLSNTGYINSFRVRAPIEFKNANTGFVCGTNISKTTNAGASWTSVLTSPGISELEAGDDDTLYAAEWGYNTKLFRSTNAGTNWSEIFSYSTESIRSLDFLTAKNGMMTIRNYVKTTTDAANTWTTATITNPEVTNLFTDIEMSSPLNAVVTGYFGKIYKTEDGGTLWNEVLSPTKRNIIKLTYGPDGTGYILAEDAQILRQSTEQTYTLVFTVTNTSGIPVTDAVLTLNGFTYPAGVYEMDGLLPGVYTWSIDCAGYCTQNGITNVGSDTEEVIVLGNCYDALIVVENVFNEPVQGASVTLAGQTHLTNDIGLAAFNMPEGEALNLSVSATGYLLYTASIALTSDSTYTIPINADLGTPLALDADQIGYYQFSANWEKPAEADSCLLYVSDDDFATFVPGFNGKSFAGTNTVVTGLNDNTEYKYRLKAKNEFGLSEFSNEIKVTTLIVSAIKHDAARLNVYPNPAVYYINLKLDFTGNVSVDIFDSKGSIAKHQSVEVISGNTLIIAVDDLPAGIYLLRIDRGDICAKTNFIKL